MTNQPIKLANPRCAGMHLLDVGHAIHRVDLLCEQHWHPDAAVQLLTAREALWQFASMICDNPANGKKPQYVTDVPDRLGEVEGDDE